MPKKHVPKTYFAVINEEVTSDDINKFEEGIVLEDGYECMPGKLAVKDKNTEIELTICEGKFHQVKRMFKAIGKEVIYLKRVRMGKLELDNELELGEYRELTEEEIILMQQK